MIKKRMSVLLVIALLVTCCAGSLFVKAATYYDYSGAVYAVKDYESSNKKKETTGSAYNKYQKSTTSGIKLVSWIENSSGENCTYKTSYSSYKTVTMDYKKASECKGYYHHLNISIQAGVVDSAVVYGTWTPN